MNINTPNLNAVKTISNFVALKQHIIIFMARIIKNTKYLLWNRINFILSIDNCIIVMLELHQSYCIREGINNNRSHTYSFYHKNHISKTCITLFLESEVDCLKRFICKCIKIFLHFRLYQ